jgi:phage shock protein A
MSEIKRLIRALWEISTPRWYRTPRVFEPEVLLNAAQREMEAIHARNRERAVLAITQKNHLYQMVQDLERKIETLEEKATEAERKNDLEVAKELRRQQAGYQSALDSSNESVARAVDAAEAIKLQIQYEQQLIREKTAKFIALQAKWNVSEIEDSVRLELTNEIKQIFDENYSHYELKSVRDLIFILLGVIGFLIIALALAVR